MKNHKKQLNLSQNLLFRSWEQSPILGGGFALTPPFQHVIFILKFILPYLPVNIIIALNPAYTREMRRINHPNTQIWPLVVGPLADS